MVVDINLIGIEVIRVVSIAVAVVMNLHRVFLVPWVPWVVLSPLFPSTNLTRVCVSDYSSEKYFRKGLYLWKLSFNVSYVFSKLTLLIN